MNNCKQKQSLIRYIFKLKNIEVKRTISVNDEILLCNINTFKKQMNFNDEWKSPFNKKDVILAVKLKGEDDFNTYREAKEIAQKIVNLINFVDGVDRGPYVELKDINFTNTEKGMQYLVKNETISDEKDYIWKIRETLEAGLDGWQPPYILTEEFEDWARLIPKILNNKDDKKENKLEKSLVNSIDWLGRAVADTNPTDAFLETMIALEAICETKDLFNKLIEDKKIRRNKAKKQSAIWKQIKVIMNYVCENESVDWHKTYNLRSKIVHNGKIIDRNEYKCFVSVLKCARKLVEELLFNKKYTNIEDTYELWQRANKSKSN